MGTVDYLRSACSFSTFDPIKTSHTSFDTIQSAQT